MKLSGQQQMVVTWAGLGLVGVGLAYVLVRYVIPKLAGGTAKGALNSISAVNDALSKNDLTQNSTDFSGDKVDYSGHSVVGDLAAGANDVSGGTLASLGESIGTGLYSIFGAKDTASSTVDYLVLFPDGKRHAVPASSVDGSGNFSYDGQQYTLGTTSSGRIATPAYGQGYNATPNSTWTAPNPTANSDMGGSNFGLTDPNSW